MKANYSKYSQCVTASVVVALLVSATLAAGQGDDVSLKVHRPSPVLKQYDRIAPPAELDRSAAFGRLKPGENSGRRVASKPEREGHNRAGRDGNASLSKSFKAASAITTQSFGTGGGDVFEDEPNGVVAQGVSLPVNVFGEISRNSDVDYFAFQALAGQEITVEAFAARLRRSELIADIALFTSTGTLLDSEDGDEDDDPVLRYTPAVTQVLVVGIAGGDDSGGSSSEYILNITRGRDVEEDEPNERTAQSLPQLPVTVFGDVDGQNDVDFYSFVASAGQTLIVDIDAEVFGSDLDSEIILADPLSGVEFIYNDQHDGDDSRLNIVLPFTGRYVVGVGASDSDSRGYYRLNLSLVPALDAPIVADLSRPSKKLLEVGGARFRSGSVIELNGRAVSTTYVNPNRLRTKVKVKAGMVVTVSGPPDGRRSNPMIVQ